MGCGATLTKMVWHHHLDHAKKLILSWRKISCLKPREGPRHCWYLLLHRSFKYKQACITSLLVHTFWPTSQPSNNVQEKSNQTFLGTHQRFQYQHQLELTRNSFNKNILVFQTPWSIKYNKLCVKIVPIFSTSARPPVTGRSSWNQGLLENWVPRSSDFL